MLKCKHISAYPSEYLSLFGHPKDGEGDTLREFISAIERLSGPRGIGFRSDDDMHKFKGDCLEVLSELFFTRFNSDPAMGLAEYVPVKIEDDFGVDAIGVNPNGDKSAVQVKYRSNPKDVVTYADVARTYSSGVKMLGIDPCKPRTIFVFTTAQDVSFQCKKVFGDSLVIINRNILARAINNNRNFWRLSYEEVREYVSFHAGSYSI